MMKMLKRQATLATLIRLKRQASAEEEARSVLARAIREKAYFSSQLSSLHDESKRRANGSVVAGSAIGDWVHRKQFAHQSLC